VVLTRSPAQPVASTVAGLVQSFPLIARPAPPCLAMEQRVAQLAKILDGPFGQEGALFATHTLTQAAALASECQRPQEAIHILRRHLAVYADQATLSAPAVIAMLEPATDLARLSAMAGHPDQAVTWLTRLMHAVRTGTSASVDRYVLPLDQVEDEPSERHLLQVWAWSRLLGCAVKILQVAGRWAEAADLVARHDGLSTRLTETRQAVIVAHLMAGDLFGARHHLDQAQPTQPWEQEISSCLSVLTAEPGDRVETAAAMIGAYKRSVPAAHLAVYRARYAVTVIRLARAVGRHPYAGIARQAAAEAIAVGDGHAAREILRTVPGCLSRKDIAALERDVTRAGLRGGALSGNYLTRLRSTADRATTILQDSLQATQR
jgi:hypothetical protein